MKANLLFSLSALAVLAGCETIQTPQRRQQTAARQQAAGRMAEERIYKLQGQVDSIEMENARLLQEMQQLRSEVRAFNGQIARLNSNMQALEAKQVRETQEVVNRVQKLLVEKIPGNPPNSRSGRGAGREHVVEKGHTLSVIAQAYGTTVKAIKQANNLKSDNIYIGQKLFIPE